MAKVDLVRLIRHRKKDLSWYEACLEKLWLNEYERVRTSAGDTERVVRTKFASSAVARRAYRAAIRARETDGFVERCDIGTPSTSTINGKGLRANWCVAGTKSWWGRGVAWGDDVEIVVVDTTKQPKPASRRRRS